MFKQVKTSYYTFGAAITVGLMSSTSAYAAGGNNFSSIGKNISLSIAELPNLLSGLAYMFGLLLAVLGVMKIKDHVENPGNTPLKDGAIRLAAGGALFALPIVLEAMYSTIGEGAEVTAAPLASVSWGAP